MKRYVTLTAAALLAVALDAAALTNLAVRPWLLLATALAACAALNVQSAILTALLGGLMLDAMCNSYLGLTAACYLLSVSVLWLLIQKNHPKTVVLLLYAALCTALYAPVEWLYSYLTGAHFGGLKTILTVALPNAALTGLFVWPLSALLQWAKTSRRDRL